MANANWTCFKEMKKIENEKKMFKSLFNDDIQVSSITSKKSNIEVMFMPL